MIKLMILAYLRGIIETKIILDLEDDGFRILKEAEILPDENKLILTDMKDFQYYLTIEKIK